MYWVGCVRFQTEDGDDEKRAETMQSIESRDPSSRIRGWGVFYGLCWLEGLAKQWMMGLWYG